MKILILGKNGQLGRCLFDQLIDSRQEIKFTSRDDLDLLHHEETKEFILTFDPSLIVNATSYNAVDMAEDDFLTANIVNNLAVRNIANVSKAIGSKFIHVSTDYVFDGNTSKPYKVDAKPNPVSKYGISKLKGELSIESSLNDYLIIRTSWLFSEYGSNFMKTMLKIGSKNHSVNVVHDEIGSPTYAQDLASAIIATFQRIEDGTCPWGLYHYSGNKACSWFDFSKKIFFHAKKLEYKVPKKIYPIHSSEYKTKAKRPKYSALDTEKFTQEFGVPPSDWNRGIISVLDAMRTN